MIDQQLWTRDRFPVLHEGNEPKAVLVAVEELQELLLRFTEEIDGR